MDANVQVAVVSVFSTAVATLGVVLAALINKSNQPKVTAKDVGLDDESEWDVKEIIGRMILLLKEIERHEATIEDLQIHNKALINGSEELKEKIRELKAQVRALKEHIRELTAPNNEKGSE